MSSGDPAIVYSISMSVAEPPRWLPMESNYPRTKEWSDAAVAASQNNRTPAPRTSLGYKMAWERTSGDPSPPSQSSRDFTLGYMEKLPQHNAGAPRDAALQRRGAHAPHAWKSESDIPEIHRQDQERIPLFSHGHRRTNGSIGNGVHPSAGYERPPQPPSPTTMYIHNGEYRDRFGRAHAVLGPLATLSTQQQPQQPPHAMTAHQSALLSSLSSQTPQRKVTDEKPARTVQDDTRPARRTNVICRDYTKGLCRNEDCPRAHVLEVPPEMLAMLPQAKQRTPNVQVAAAVHPSVLASNVELCKLNLVGKCPRGDACKYSHQLGPVDPRSPSPTPDVLAGPSRSPDSRVDISAPPSMIHGLPQKPMIDEQGAAAPSSSMNRNPNFIVYPDDVCRKHIQGDCHYSRCRFTHWSPEEIRAFREARRAELDAPTDVVASVTQVGHAPVSLVSPTNELDASHLAVTTPDDVTVSGSESGPDDHEPARPPDTARKRHKKRRGGTKPSGKDVDVKSPGQKGNEKGRAEQGQVEMHVKTEKGKNMDVSAPGNAAVQGKREEKSDKGKSRVKRGTDEKEIAAHSGIRKGKAKEDPLPKVTAKDVERQAATAQCGKLTDPKGKGVARPAPPRVADADKGHASQPAPTEPPRTGTKKNLSKKTGSTQSSAPIARASPPQPGPSSIQAAASDTDTETDNSDVTFYSSRNAGVVTAQTSLSSVEGGSSAMIPPKGLCFDYLEGHCYRQICRYSHNVDRTLFSNTSRPNAPSLASAEGGAQLTNNDGFYRSSDRMTQDVAGRGNDPQVPPGLGLERMLPSGRDEETAEQSETVTITVHDSTKVTFSSGFGVAQVITGFESRQIILANLPPTVVPLDITTTLQSTFGEVVAVIPGESNTEGSVVYRVTFAQADAAAEAAAALHGSSLFGVRVTARVAAKKSTGIGGGTLEDGDVLFELPTPRLTAFIGYETKEQADRAIVLGDRKEIKGMLVSASRYQGIPMVGAYNVRFDGMPPDTTVKDLERFGKFESHMFARPKYSSMSGAIQGLRYKLLQLDERVTVNVLPPPYRKMFRLWAHFSDEQVAAVACENLHGFCPHFTGKQRIFAHHIKSLSYNLPPDFFDILAYDINLLRSYCVDDKGTSISVIDRRHSAGPTAPVFVKLVSRDMPALSKLKAAFDRLLRGEKVTENGHVVWDDFFASPAGIAFLADLERFHPKVRINRDPRRRTLALFGQEPQRGRAREDILARAKLLKARRQRRYPVAGDLIGVFMSEDVCKLQSELGHDNVWFDLTHKELVVRGDEDSQKVARLAVNHARQRRQRRATRADAGCPVCFGEVSHPITLSCGHRWCRACLVGYMHASVDNKTFPLKCLGDDAKCSHCIPLATAQQLLDPDEFDAIVRASFTAYVQARPDEFHYCPTPDCPQVYRKTKRNTVLQCPSCLIRICPHCDTEWHESGSCQDRDPQEDYLFEQWKGRHDVKDCPSCKVPIERMAGCNHMTCVSCKTHICWACLATFPTSQEVYDHMRAIHGGIGL